MNDSGYILYILSFIPTYVYWEINELLNRGVNVQILNLGNSFRAAMWEKITGLNEDKELSKYFIDTVEVNVTEAFQQTAEKISRLLINEPVKRIHTHFAKKEAQIGVRLAKILGVPFSVTTHANDIFVPKNYDELKYLLEESSQVFTISEFNKNYLKRYVDENKAGQIKVIYLGINLDKLPQRIKKNRNYHSIHSTASGLVEKKGIRYLIHACEILKAQGISFKCTIAGSDPDGKILFQLKEQIKNLGLSEQIKLPGIIPSQNLLQQIASCDAFILPCAKADSGSMDGIPVSLIEAMGIGVPVISTSISGIPELISNGQNGLLVAPKNSQAIVDALIYIFKNPLEGERMGNSARQTVQNKFSVGRYINQIMNYWGIDNLPVEKPSESAVHLSNLKNS